MNLGIVLRRANQWRYAEGAAITAKDRGHKVYVLCWHREGDTKRAATPATVSAPGFEVLDAAPLGEHPDMDAMLVPAALDFQPFRCRSGQGPMWAALQTSWSDLVWLEPEVWDSVYAWSDNWGQWWRQANLNAPGKSPRNFVPVGHPLAGTLARILGPHSIESYKANEQPSLLYYPFPWGAHHLDSLFYLKMLWRDRETVSLARRAADALRWPLVVSSRSKVHLPEYTRQAADYVISGDSLEHMASAGLFVHHCSSGAAEAVLASTPAINVAPEGWRAYEGRGEDFDPWRDYNFYAWPGVSVRHWMRDFMEGPRPIIESRRRKYIERYLGFNDPNTGARIVADLEKRVVAHRGMRVVER